MATGSQIPSSSSSSAPPKLESLSLEPNQNAVPWLHLPDSLTEKILERLPIFDYARFAAVCAQWRSVQENHRRRHAPSPPPMLKLPWFVPIEPQQQPVVCSIPFPLNQNRSHRIQITLPRRYLEQGTESEGRSWRFSLPNGWLVLDDKPFRGRYHFTLLNPISGSQIELPGEGNGLYMGCKLAASPPPGCVAFLMAYDKWNMHIRLFRERDGCWTVLQFPDRNMQWGASIDETSALVWEGKVYYMYLSRGLMVIDPLPIDPAIEFLEMDQSQLPPLRCGWVDDIFHAMELFMVESNGKMMLVVEFFESDPSSDAFKVVVGFQVFEANFSSMRWVRVESLGDRVLFIHQKFVCSMLADDIGVRRNCIYCLDPAKVEKSYTTSSSRVGPIPWKVFDLGTGKLRESPLPYAPSPYSHRMFVPSLC